MALPAVDQPVRPPASPSRAPEPDAPRGSRMAEALRGSQILKIAAEIRALVAEGKSVCNLTVGDFSPAEFPIPELLRQGVEEALRAGETNYPPSNGVPMLRDAVATFYRERLGMECPADGVLIAGGARPGIYAVYRTLVDEGDRVVFPVPSWNNPDYCQTVGAVPVPVVCEAADAFLPTRATLERAVRGARLLVLNSPLNPGGTAFDAETLGGICDLVVEENARRGPGERPLYLLYDQVYWMLTLGDVRHVHPVQLRPAVAPYTIYVDAISKAFAATGLRVGWVTGPADLVRRMSDFLGHVGAWAPRAEQVAAARLLAARSAVDGYHAEMRRSIQARLDALYGPCRAMADAGLPVDAVRPAAAIYLSARFNLLGRRTPDGQLLRDNEDVRGYLLRAAGFAVVPFQAFGLPDDTGWFRLSVGAVSVATIEAAMPRVRAAIEAVSAAE